MVWYGMAGMEGQWQSSSDNKVLKQGGREGRIWLSEKLWERCMVASRLDSSRRRYLGRGLLGIEKG